MSPEVPQDLLDLLREAQAKLDAAAAADAEQRETAAVLANARAADNDKQAAALDRHRDATLAGNELVAAVRAHFGLDGEAPPRPAPAPAGQAEAPPAGQAEAGAQPPPAGQADELAGAAAPRRDSMSLKGQAQPGPGAAGPPPIVTGSGSRRR